MDARESVWKEMLSGTQLTQKNKEAI